MEAELRMVAPALAHSVSSRGTTAGIKYQVGFFEKATSAYGDQLRIAGTGSDNFDVPLTYGGGVHGDGYSKVSAFLFGQE